MTRPSQASPLETDLRARLAAACSVETVEALSRRSELSRETVRAARDGRPVHRSTARLLALALATLTPTEAAA